MKDIVRQLYANLLKFAATRGSANNAMFQELFPPVGVLSSERVAELEQLLGVGIQMPSLYEQALTHRSYLQVVNSPDHRSNERLEFLGDAILGMVTAEYLFYNNREVLEGELTKMRSWIVNKKSLAICARALKLDDYWFLSYSASQSLQRGNDSRQSLQLSTSIVDSRMFVGLSSRNSYRLWLVSPSFTTRTTRACCWKQSKPRGSRHPATRWSEKKAPTTRNTLQWKLSSTTRLSAQDRDATRRTLSRQLPRRVLSIWLYGVSRVNRRSRNFSMTTVIINTCANCY